MFIDENLLPFVTVILPIRNEVGFINQSLSAVLDQDYPKTLTEIIVADGMSTDGTRELIKTLMETNSNLYMVDNPKKIVPTGLNIAICQAKGQVIVRVDGHTIIEKDYISRCVEELSRTGADNVGGRMRAVGNGLFGEVVSLATSTPFGIGNSRFHYSDDEEWVDTVYMGTWPKEVFFRIGLFDEELVRDQDDEFNYRLLENGGRILLSPKIKSMYFSRSEPWKLWRQYYQYGFWKVRVMQKHPRQIRIRHFIPPLFVLSILISVVLSLITFWGKLLLGVILVSYVFANLFASFQTALNSKVRHLVFLPLTFAILHLSYGSGLLIGLLRFASRWKDRQGKAPILVKKKVDQELYLSYRDS